MALLNKQNTRSDQSQLSLKSHGIRFSKHMSDPLRLIRQYIAVMNIISNGAGALAPVAPGRTKVPSPVKYLIDFIITFKFPGIHRIRFA